ncbi:hypothetical protein B0H17DRAFT_1058115 [Mycena rosella]|uniref:Uncharacterized protein n=1 Tax=Mycena rosella TaxID=1033263 RepID=A0AAD7GGS2_MYCRO|nr:hypothetical protein B0H17DRAFT_1058115 [Mycena rosella]
MVQLLLASTKGNHGVRYFPYSGYLGLTTLKVDGVVRTKLDPDLKPLPAKSITISVRCYEARLGRLGVMHSNVLVDYTQVLWSKPDDGNDYADIGDLELPFRISIPAKVAGFSTASFVEFRCTWRVEAIVNHVPILGVGSRQIKHSELPLLRFDHPPEPSPSSFTTIGQPILDSEVSHPNCPPIRYSINSPTAPVGPLDLVSIPIHLLPRDPGVSFRSASVIVERRMRLMDPPSPPSTPTILSNMPTTLQAPSPSGSLPIPQRTSSSSSSLSYSPSSSYTDSSSQLSSSATLQPSDSRTSTSGASLLVNSIAGSESSGLFACADSGIWSKTLTLQWPAAKSQSRWAIGETIESELVSVKFFARVKVVVSSSLGTESLELEEKELLVVSTNEAERQLALSKYNDALYSNYSDGGRSKSKSPRRSRRLHDDAPPLPASASRAEHSHRVSSSSSHYSSSASTSKPPRRPHTSAGTRDKSRTGGSISGREGESTEAQAGERFRRRRPDAVRPDTGGNAEIAASHSVSKGYFNAPWTITTAAGDSGGSASTTSLSTSTSASSTDSNPSDEVREWEEELVRIEMRSRRSSDLVGFSTRRRP